MTDVVVRVRGLTVHPAARPVPSLDGIDLDVPTGQHVLVVGPSGCGKSTFLHVLTGVVPQSYDAEVSGDISVLGRDPRTTPVPQLALDVGWLGQDPASNACLPTVLDEVALPLENRGVPRAEIGGRVRHALESVGAGHLAGRRVGRLSGGEQQRVALAAVLVGDPELLLLDEPTSMLDPVAADRVLRLLGAHSAGRTTVLVEHRLSRMAWRPERTVALTAGGRPNPHGVRLPPAGPDVAAQAPDRRRRAPRGGAGAVALHLRGGSFEQGGHAVVSGVDLDLREGQVTAVVGVNGSGKSSLLLGLAGLLPGTTPTQAHEVGLVFQRPEHQFLRRTVAAEVGDRELLTRLGLDAFASADPFRLSGGQQRRLSVAAVAALGRRVLALDEPTFGLDDEQTQAVVDLLTELAHAGTAVVLATHDLELARAVADQVLVLHEGTVVAVGAPDLLTDVALLRRARLLVDEGRPTTPAIRVAAASAADPAAQMMEVSDVG